MKVSSKFLMVAATIASGLTLVACSADDAATSTATEASLADVQLVKAPKVAFKCSEGILGEDNRWYFKVQDYENTTKEHMPAVYAKFVDGAPKKGNGEAVTDDEKTFVLNYLDEHPNEGSTEFNHYNYFIQYVGGVNREYETTKDQNGADHKTGKSTSQIDYIEFVDQNGTARHINDYNANGGPRALVLNCKITTAQYHDSWGDKDNTHSDKYRFYTIEYNGEKNLYLCYDYATAKNSGEFFGGDGKYNDYVIKIIPGCGDEEETTEPTDPTEEPTVTPDPGDEGDKKDPETPTTPVVPTPSTVAKKANVEVNLAVQDHKDGELSSKLAVHVRDTANFKVFIPVELKDVCDVDDMYIVERHTEQSMTYNAGKTTTITRNIGGSYDEESQQVVGGTDVTLTITYTTQGIYVESKGINKEVLQYCRNVYNDGLTFEVYNYYNKNLANDEIGRSKLAELLNKATITFTDNQPAEYINTIKESNVVEDLLLDCKVTNTAATEEEK